MKFAIHERPALTVSCLVRAEQGRVAEARIAVGSVSAVPARVPEAETALLGLGLKGAEAPLAQVGDAAADASTPIADANGSVDYKRNLVRVFVGRCCREALGRVASSKCTEEVSGSRPGV
jgi:aerobic carbon-monoxide dehydrogenase medium subunit